MSGGAKTGGTAPASPQASAHSGGAASGSSGASHSGGVRSSGYSEEAVASSSQGRLPRGGQVSSGIEDGRLILGVGDSRSRWSAEPLTSSPYEKTFDLGAVGGRPSRFGIGGEHARFGKVENGTYIAPKPTDGVVEVTKVKVQGGRHTATVLKADREGLIKVDLSELGRGDMLSITVPGHTDLWPETITLVF